MGVEDRPAGAMDIYTSIGGLESHGRVVQNTSLRYSHKGGVSVFDRNEG